MRTYFALLLFGFVPFVSLAAANGAEDKPAKPDVEQLISDLGSDEYAVREHATEALTELGLPALAALESAAIHPDREVRYRALRVLGIIRQDDMQRRLDAFLSGDDEGESDALPGWQRFKKGYGDNPAARSLFVDIQRADPELMQALDANPQSAAELIAQRTAAHEQLRDLGGQQVSLGQVAAMLFVASQDEVKLPSHLLSTVFSQCFQPAFRDVVSHSARGEIPRKMLGTLIRRSDDLASYQAMNIAYQYNIPEGIVPAEKILASKDGNRQPHMQHYALMAIARLGDKSHLPQVEKLLTDVSPLGRTEESHDGEKVAYELQMRDAALATMVLLTKQKLPDYFAIPDNLQNLDLQMIFFNPSLIGFPNEAKRAETFAKWEKWKAAQ